ncbi:MAG: alpha/beta hydrolase [Gordonia sp. (in: high G+C Gram-positive bacteria)]
MPGKKRFRKSAPPPAKQLTELAHRGPHPVLTGSLGIVGIDGQVFAPAAGTGLPALAFGHAWLADGRRYRDLLYHLASWGFVVAVPHGHSGVLPSDVGLASELRSALSMIAHAPLGDGGITVDPERIGFAGHGFGAAAAALAASPEVFAGQQAPSVAGVVAIFPAPTTRILLPAAAEVTAPGLVLAAPGALDTVDANARPLAAAWGGDVVLRTVPGADSRKLLERRSWKSLIGINGADKKTHRQVRALMTGFLRYTVAADDHYAGFADPAAVIGKSPAVDPQVIPDGELDHISALLGAKARKRGRVARLLPVR